MATIDDHGAMTTAIASPLRALEAWLDPGEPHPFRGPFTRWPRTADAVLAVAVFAASLVAVTLSALDDGQDLTSGSLADRPVGAIVLLALAAAALWWRRPRPVETMAAVLVVLVAWAVAGYGDGQDLALVVAAYSVSRHTADQRRSLAALVAAVAVALVGTLIDVDQRVDVLPAVLLAVVPWWVGRQSRNRVDYLALLQERARRLEAEQHARARQAVADERSRIARELHDVVAHRVSMMTVQAGAAKTVASVDPDAAVEAMGDVEREGRQALGELRHLLGVLRAEADDPRHLGPQPGLADLASLVDGLADTGAEISLTVGDLPELPAAVDLSAYRIVQESFTNVVKHAGPAPTVEVSIGLDGDGLVIDIANSTANSTADRPADRTANSAAARAPGSTAARAPGSTADGAVRVPQLPRSGFGLVGMRERASVLGGSLAAGPRPPDRFAVRAHLPLTPESP